VSLCGAGGGGFMYILAKDKKSVLKIKAALEKNPPTKYSRFYKFDFDSRGLELG
jgi:galactokinase/mevalonate kinase-like predicted kinase